MKFLSFWVLPDYNLSVLLRLVKLKKYKKLFESIVMHLKGMARGLIKPWRKYLSDVIICDRIRIILFFVFYT